MEDEGIQVATGLKRRKQTNTGSQSTPEVPKLECGTQCGVSLTGSYRRNNKHQKWQYDDLIKLMLDKELLIHWLMAEWLIVKGRLCPICAAEMGLTTCDDRSDGLK